MKNGHFLMERRVEGSRLLQRRSTQTSTEFCVLTLDDPVVDPVWLSTHPRFQYRLRTPQQLPRIDPRFYAKKIYNRVPSGSQGSQTSVPACSRRERSKANSACRFCCELLGPNLCNDCSKLLRRTNAVLDYRHELLRGVENTAARDPFHVLMSSRKKQTEYSESEEELFQETEDEEFVLMSANSQTSSMEVSPSQRDSGYASRMSYIRSLSRTPSGSLCRLESPTKPRKRSATLNTRGGIAGTSFEHERVLDSTAIWNNAYLTRLREREGFKNILQNIYFPRKVRHAWRNLPVEPVELELKLINFTIYDNVKINQRER